MSGQVSDEAHVCVRNWKKRRIIAHNQLNYLCLWLVKYVEKYLNCYLTNKLSLNIVIAGH